MEFKKEKHKPYQSEYHSLHCLDTQVIESAKAHFLQNYIEGNGKIFYINVLSTNYSMSQNEKSQEKLKEM